MEKARVLPPLNKFYFVGTAFRFTRALRNMVSSEDKYNSIFCAIPETSEITSKQTFPPGRITRFTHVEVTKFPLLICFSIRFSAILPRSPLNRYDSIWLNISLHFPKCARLARYFPKNIYFTRLLEICCVDDFMIWFGGLCLSLTSIFLEPCYFCVFRKINQDLECGGERFISFHDSKWA